MRRPRAYHPAHPGRGPVPARRGLSTVASAAAAFETATDGQGWSHIRVRDHQEFIRLAIADRQDTLIIDLGRDSPAAKATGSTQLGPTLSPRDLATRKTPALFGRAEPRDFADVHDLVRRYGRDRLLQWAAEDDPGFDRQIFADMLATIDRLTDADLPLAPAGNSAARLDTRLGCRPAARHGPLPRQDRDAARGSGTRS